MPPFRSVFMKKVANAAGSIVTTATDKGKNEQNRPGKADLSIIQQVASAAVSVTGGGFDTTHHTPTTLDSTSNSESTADDDDNLDLGQVIKTSKDSNAKTVARALQTAQDYLAKPGMSNQALRELERAKTSLTKMDQSSTLADLPMFASLQALLNRLHDLVMAQQDQETFDRVMTQVNRYKRYTQEAIDKKNVNEANRQVEQWKKYVKQLPPSKMEVPQAELDAALTRIATLVLASQHASAVRQLERQIKSTRDTVTRAGGTMTEAALEPYVAKCQTILETLPAELQVEYQPELEALQAQVSATARQETKPQVLSNANNGNTTTPMTSFANKVYTSASGAVSSSSIQNKTSDSETSSPSPSGLDPGKRRVAERCLNGARDMLNRRETDRVASQIEYLSNLMNREAWPEAHQAEFRPIMSQLEADCEAQFLEKGRERLWKSIENCFERMQNAMDDQRRQGSAMKDRVEHEIDTVSRLVENEKHLLSGEQLDSLPGRIAAVRVATKVCLENYQMKEVERLVDRYADLLMDPSDLKDHQRVEAYRRNATEAINNLPEHTDISAFEQRIKDVDEEVQVVWKANEKQNLMEKVVDEYEYAVGNHFTPDKGPSFDQWREQGRLHMEDLYEAVDRAQTFLKCREVNNAIKMGMEDDIRKMIDAANNLVQTGSAFFMEAITELTAAADIENDPKDLAHELSFLSQQIGDFKGTKESVSQCKALVEEVQAQIQAKLNAQDEAEKQVKQQLADHASSVFANCVKTYADKIMDLDAPAEVRQSPATYKGKFIRLVGRQNRMSWDFDQDDHALILRVNGVPLCADFDQRIAAQAKEMENKWDPNGYNSSFDDVIIELSRGTAIALPFHQVYDGHIRRWHYLPPEEAIHGKIVAFVRGPQAAGILHGKVVTSLK